MGASVGKTNNGLGLQQPTNTRGNILVPQQPPMPKPLKLSGGQRTMPGGPLMPNNLFLEQMRLRRRFFG